MNDLDFDDPDVQEYKRAYKAKYGIETELNGGLVRDAMAMLLDAIQRAGKADGEAVAKALESTNIKGITGTIKISAATHNPEGKDAAIIKIVSGKYVFQQKYAAQ